MAPASAQRCTDPSPPTPGQRRCPGNAPKEHGIVAWGFNPRSSAKCGKAPAGAMYPQRSAGARCQLRLKNSPPLFAWWVTSAAPPPPARTPPVARAPRLATPACPFSGQSCRRLVPLPEVSPPPPERCNPPLRGTASVLLTILITARTAARLVPQPLSGNAIRNDDSGNLGSTSLKGSVRMSSLPGIVWPVLARWRFGDNVRHADWPRHLLNGECGRRDWGTRMSRPP